jgi:hypothetical protein
VQVQGLELAMEQKVQVQGLELEQQQPHQIQQHQQHVQRVSSAMVALPSADHACRM